MSQRTIVRSSILNNKAASLIKQHKYSQANRLLASALAGAKRAQEQHPYAADAATTGADHQVTQQDMDDLCTTAAEGYVHSDTQNMAHPQQTQQRRPQSPTNKPMTTDAHTLSSDSHRAPSAFIYRRPMTIGIHDLQGCQYDVFSLLSFVVMFNLAITYHLMALRDITDNTGTNASGTPIAAAAVADKRMRSAVKLYELTFQVQSQGLVPHAAVTSAILNNLTLCHKVLGDDEKYMACSEMLLSAVMLLVDVGVTSTPVDVWQTGDGAMMVDGFLDNVMHLLSGQSGAAGAA